MSMPPSTSSSAPASASPSSHSASTIVITGAGSGVGRAVAQLFARAGWRLALVGRRRDALEATVASLSPDVASAFVSGSAGAGAGVEALARDDAEGAAGSLAGGATSGTATAIEAGAGETSGAMVDIFPCDVGDPAAVKQMAAEVLARFGRVDVLVNGAGTNTPRRSWRELAHEDYHALLAANLHGAFYCVETFLPSMRAQGGGTVININSEAGRLASPKAGVAYVASKFGLAGLTQSLNAEERGNGIRACSIFPGDIDTPILDKRPQPPTPEARALMLQSEDIAQCVWLAATLPSRAIIEELVIRPR